MPVTGPLVTEGAWRRSLVEEGAWRRSLVEEGARDGSLVEEGAQRLSRDRATWNGNPPQ